MIYMVSAVADDPQPKSAVALLSDGDRCNRRVLPKIHPETSPLAPTVASASQHSCFTTRVSPRAKSGCLEKSAVHRRQNCPHAPFPSGQNSRRNYPRRTNRPSAIKPVIPANFRVESHTKRKNLTV